MIEVNNLSNQKIDKTLFKNIAKIVLQEEKEHFDISIAFVGPERIMELNNQYRRKNKPTDVLSFADKELKEIIICPSEVSGGKMDLAKVFIHGLLHILEYDHKSMLLKEKKYFKLCQKLT